MNIAAVIVTHNRAKLLKDVLQAILDQTRAIQLIIVVDNASSSETMHVLQGFKKIDILRFEENIGGAGGFAAGVERATIHGSDWVLLLDDDAIAEPDLVECLIDALPSPLDERVGALCSSVFEFSRVALMHRRMFDPRTLREPVVPNEYYSRMKVRVDTASFVGFLLNTQAVREIGFPNASFFLAYDDTEYSLRLGRAGWFIWLVPSAVINHLRNPKRRLRDGPYATKHYYNLRNQLAVFRYYGTAPRWRAWLPIILHGFIAAKDLRISSLCTWLRALRDSRSIIL
ncbi:glycosyltransferase [Candidatus Vallotia tarda]|uniref:Glycosyl transferase, family 2 n=1 Tax=Candidatus Vallotiella hemipterorum TaxID=1177213 RepID=A0A916JS40_9BURK|nr:glycosyltransferase [Candidatus Vallotia tarda]CAG7598789.1 Glycosyl transferase, family 2 [Candidatus Vallotia tarda]